jgi:hypothetical protein
MIMNRIRNALFIAVLAAAPALGQAPSQPSAAQAAAGPWDPASRLAAQREAMQALAFLDGTWRGDASYEGRSDFVQTERVGPLLGGTVKLVEGRGYGAGGETVFNALGVISYDPVGRTYSMRSYAMGYTGDFPLTVRPDGFSWSHPVGPGRATMRYTATVQGGEWHEIGERVTEGAAPVRVFEMRLRRIGTSDWPQTAAVAPR